VSEERPIPKKAGEWENLGVSLVDLTDSIGIGSGREVTSKDTHRIHLLILFAAIAAFLLLLESIGTFTLEPEPVCSYEIDLSGAWKIHFGDDVGLAAPELDDSGWCRVGVPDPGTDLGELAQAQPEDCPPPHLIAARMLNAVIWYRYTVTIEEEPEWNEPALFLGSVRSHGRVYWDGAYVGRARRELEPVAIELEREQVAAGTHLLALRVECGTEERPGIDHSYARKVALGEYANCLPEASQQQHTLALAVLGILIQAVAFMLLALLTIEARGEKTELFWLAVFFGSVLLYAVQRLTIDPLAWYLRSLAIASASISALGFGLEHSLWSESLRRSLHRIFALIWVVLVLIFTVAFFTTSDGAPLLMGDRRTAVFMPIVVFAAFLWWLVHRISFRHEQVRRSQKLKAPMLVLALYCTLLAEFFGLVPGFPVLRSPFFLPLFSCLVFYYVLQWYTDALRSLAFYGRFIRPGLKRLIKEKGRSIFGDEKLFRGRKTIIMKIDTVDHTRTTFGMPYGMRRLFLDLWYTLIDLVVADKVFLDKSLGDGSVYCFRDGIPGGTCTAALRSAIEIRDRQIRLFDETFYQSLRDAMTNIEELQAPAEAFFKSYEERTGESFWKRRTRVRIALVSGYVDEGLWGLSSQSHYDVHGCPLVLATRIEASAQTGEIVFDQAFVDELERESPGLLDHGQLKRREQRLKGIGQWQLYALPEDTRIPPEVSDSVG
jgi:class 3 adenylate cyclase